MLDIAKDSNARFGPDHLPAAESPCEKEYANSAVSRRFQDDAIKANRNPKSSLIVVRACDGGDAQTTGPNLSTEGFLPGPAVAAVGRSRGRSPVRKARRRAGQSDVTTLTGTGVRGADGPVIGPKVPYRRCLRA
jgi:hypothetical protein